MVADMPFEETLPTKPAGARPPTEPPILVTYDPDPGDGDRDMLVYLRDNIRMLLARMTDITSDQVRQYIDLLSLRRKWVQEEMQIEKMMESDPTPPLGLESDPYDLSLIGRVQRNFRREKFEELLRALDQAQAKLEDRFWEQMWSQNPSS